MSDTFANVVCVGAGRMGRGMAHVFAYAGRAVTLVDLKMRDAEATRRMETEALDEVRHTLGFLASLGLLDDAQVAAALALVDVVPDADADAALAGADLVFEAVPEVLEVKQTAFARIAQAVRPDAVIASTTSTMPVDQLAALAHHPARFLNTHFLNPAFLIPLVEVSAGDAADEQVVSDVMALLSALGKVPVRCSAAAGYIVPRIQTAAMAEAARLVDEGVASAEDVDRAIRAGFGPRYTTMGLLEFVDWGGLDILYHACNHLNEALGTERFTAPQGVARRMHDGHRGLREGTGFHDYRELDVPRYRERKLGEFVTLLRALDMLPEPGI